MQKNAVDIPRVADILDFERKIFRISHTLCDTETKVSLSLVTRLNSQLLRLTDHCRLIIGVVYALPCTDLAVSRTKSICVCE